MSGKRIVIKSQLPEIAAVHEQLDAFAQDFGISKPIVSKFDIALDELLSNIIFYAYNDDDEHDIEIRMELAGNRLTVTITDDGVPFDPLSVATPNTDLPLKDRVPGGLGIHLVRNLVDELSYHRRINKNVMILMSHVGQEEGAS